MTGYGQNSKRNQQTQNLIQQRLIDSSQAHFTGTLMAHPSLQLDIYSDSQKSCLAKFFIKLLVLLFIFCTKSSSGYRPATNDEWADELKGFMKNYGFPCIAAWDGFHVYLSTHLKQYFSLKKKYTVTNLGLISYNKRSLYAAVGAPGSTHDSRLLKNCSLYKKILAGDAIPQNKDFGGSSTAIYYVTTCKTLVGSTAIYYVTTRLWWEFHSDILRNYL